MPPATGAAMKAGGTREQRLFTQLARGPNGDWHAWWTPRQRCPLPLALSLACKMPPKMHPCFPSRCHTCSARAAAAQTTWRSWSSSRRWKTFGRPRTTSPSRARSSSTARRRSALPSFANRSVETFSLFKKGIKSEWEDPGG
eukprot:3651210-Prymnesium_polylepis.1